MAEKKTESENPPKRLTIKEAIEQGYKFYGETGREDLLSIEDDSVDLSDHIKNFGTMFLASKECVIPYFPNASHIIERMSEDICEEIHECGFDSIDDALSKFEYELQEVLDEMKNYIKENNSTRTYELTEIELIPNS